MAPKKAYPFYPCLRLGQHRFGSSKRKAQGGSDGLSKGFGSSSGLTFSVVIYFWLPGTTYNKRGLIITWWGLSEFLCWCVLDGDSSECSP